MTIGFDTEQETTNYVIQENTPFDVGNLM